MPVNRGGEFGGRKWSMTKFTSSEVLLQHMFLHLAISLYTDTPIAVNEEYTPVGYGTVKPLISVVSPLSSEILNYSSSNVSLSFAVDRPITSIGYSLDGQENMTP